MVQMSKKELLAELDESNDFFDMVVDMFPSQVYVSSTLQNKGSSVMPINTKYHKKGSEPAEQKINRKAARKQAKRKKLDPAASESTTELVHRQQQERHGGSSSIQETVKNTDKASKPTSEEPKPHQSRIEALRAKLQAKIAQKQSNRPESDPNQVSKRAARRAEKRKRQEEAKQRAAKKGKSATINPSKTYELSSHANASPAQDLAQVDFGRLTGLNPKKSSDPSTRDILQNLTKPKNLHKILADAEAKREKLIQLKQQGEDDKLAALQWKDTFQEADGTRVKDDPNKIKKVLKRKAAKKQKSQKAWQSRTEQSSSAAQDRLSIRNHNLSARKQGGKVGANLSRKEIRKNEPEEKKGRAGFEGRKRDFLNKEKPQAKSQQ